MTTVLDSPEARAYRDCALDLCAAIEAHRSGPAAAWLGRVHRVLPRLYAAALALPIVEPDTEARDSEPMTHEEWQRLHESLSERLGRWNDYLDAEPYGGDGEPTCGDLADDLADVHRDVSSGLRFELAARSRPNDVLWSWRFAFTSHWGKHAVSALRALHVALFEQHAAEEREDARSE